jgi:hypothetical protein
MTAETAASPSSPHEDVDGRIGRWRLQPFSATRGGTIPARVHESLVSEGALNPGIWTSRRVPPGHVKPGQGTFSDLRDVDWCCLIPASFVQFADILLTNC